MKASSRSKLRILVIAVSLISLYAGLADYDWYWQCELGKSIVRDFNFNGIYNLHWGTKGVSEYLDHEWLTNIFFYFCSLLGTYSISFAKLIICVTYAVTTILYLESYDNQYNDAAYIGVFGYLFLMSTVFIKVKAYILSVVFLLVEMMFLRKYRASQDKRCFVYMAILLVVWNNMHSGSIPMFFLVAGLYWLLELNRDKQVLKLLPIYVLLLCVNPYGFRLALFDILHNFDPVMKEVILDWRAIDGKDTLGKLCALIIIGVVVYLIGCDYKEHKFDILMIFIVLYMSFGSARHLIYLAPFLYPVILDNKYELKLNNTVRFSLYCFLVGIALLSCIKGFSAKDYEKTYGINRVAPELLEALQATNADTCDGLYATTEVALWQYGLKTFASGAYPYIRERAIAIHELTYSASDERIKELIDEWGLTKFLAIKYNPTLSYSDRPGLLYEYLTAHSDEYELLYDSNFYYYFVRKDLVA